jgi:S-DNA-T family DNA segregation ATPase FtsK/SpoIIIE
VNEQRADPPPPLSICGADGHPVTIELEHDRHTVGELAEALGLPRRAAVVIDGNPVERRVPLVRSGIVAGSQVAAGPGHGSCRAGRGVGDPTPACVSVVVEAGPAAGRAFALGPGRHTIGRAAQCAVRLDDDLVELHHALLDVAVGPGRGVDLVQLSGRVPCSVLPADGSRASGRSGPRTDSATVVVGSSRLRITAPGEEARPAVLASDRDDPWRATLHRPPRQTPAWEPRPIALPDVGATTSFRAAGGIAAAVLSVLGGITVAAVMRNPMFLVFSLVAALAAMATAVAARFGDRKRSRTRAAESRREGERFAAEVATQRDAGLAHHLQATPTLVTALTVASGLSAGLWSRRSTDGDAFVASLGWGDVPWAPLVAGDRVTTSAAAEAVLARHTVLADCPVPADLGPGHAVAVAGCHAAAVVRSLVVQLAAHTGPADWRLLVVAGDPSAWEWCGWLPHARTAALSAPLIADADDAIGLSAMIERLEGSDGRHVVVVTDRPDVFAARTGPLRRYLDTAPSAAVLAAIAPDGAVPALCRAELHVGSLGVGRWCPDTSQSAVVDRVHVAGLSPATACEAARRLAGIRDPEDPEQAADACPAAVTLSTVLARAAGLAIDDPIAVAAAWRPGGGDPAARPSRPRAAIGATADGVVEIDLVADGPHALLAGTTGAGKSELLRTLVASMAATNEPDELTFLLVDYKGGSTFDACAELPHTVGVVTDLDDRLAERALVSLDAEVRRRERLLRAAGVDDIDGYHRLARRDALSRLVVVVDEFAALAAELPGFLSSLVGVAQRGRSLGIHLVLATQRPAGVVSDEIRANTNLRIALRLQDRADAVDIVGGDEPIAFPRGIPGRALLRLGAGSVLVFQAAHSSGLHRRAAGGGLRMRRRPMAAPAGGVDDGGPVGGCAAPSELAVLVRTIRAAASLCDVRPPFRPWLEPLPDRLDPGVVIALGGDVVGLVDEPAAQRQHPLRWQHQLGNLALIGSLGSGTTTALRTLLVAAGPEAHLYVLDARRDGALAPLGTLPNCGAVVGLHDAERRSRLIGMLAAELDRRQSDVDAAPPPLVVAVDGLGTALGALAGPADLDDHARLLRVLSDGPGAGIHAVATMERPGGVAHSALAAFTQRWLFHLDDALEAAALGVPANAVPPPRPGRVLVCGDRLEAQLAVLPVETATAERPARAGGVATIGTLAESVDPASLQPSTHRHGVLTWSVGIDFATLSTARLEVPDGEHALVVGPARSGRSTALLRLAASWRGAHRGGTVVVHCPRPGSPLLTWVRGESDGVIVAGTEDEIATACGEGERRVLVVVDDAERVADTAGTLAALAAERHPRVTLVAAGRPDALRTMYGHWTGVVRRSRIGLVMSTGNDNDGDLLGEPLPRRCPVPPRPGLAWMIDGGGRRLVQVAGQASAPAGPGPAERSPHDRLTPRRS